jgi:AraC family transcriptional regulator of adaptative response / DNA-3-methyladenine glycosylase II
MLPAEVCDRARLARDRRFDGRFFTGVLTTRIYCRPICPVRPARSPNVRFFPTAAAAECAGFRPCLRCRPEAAPGSPAWHGSASTVSRALDFIDRGYLDGYRLPALAAILGMGPRHLSRLFVQHCGATPGAVARTRRVQIAKRLLDETTLRTTEVALAAGFSSLRRFHGAFRATYGRSPSAVRRHRPLSPAHRDAVALRLYYRPPYDWSAMLGFLADEALPGVERVSGDEYLRTISLDGHCGWIRVWPVRDEPALHVVVHLPDYARLRVVIDRIHTMFDLRADPHSITRALAAVVPQGAVARLQGLRVPGAWDGFEIAVRTVALDEVGPVKAGSLIDALVERFGRPLAPEGPPGLTRVFPTPHALARASLTDSGLPTRLAARVRRLACCVVRNGLALNAGAAFGELVERLVAEAGLDPDSAEWIGMRALGEPDADVAGWLRLSGRVQTWWQEGRTQQALRPWRSYAALLLAGASFSAAQRRIGSACRRRG